MAVTGIGWMLGAGQAAGCAAGAATRLTGVGARPAEAAAHGCGAAATAIVDAESAVKVGCVAAGGVNARVATGKTGAGAGAGGAEATAASVCTT